MKKLLLTTAATLLTVAAFAQGTVYFSNTAQDQISSGVYNSAASTWVIVPKTTAGLIDYGLFYAVAPTGPFTMATPLGVNSTSTAGLIANASNSRNAVTAAQVDPSNSAPGDTSYFVKVMGWSASLGTAGWVTAQAASLDGTGTHYFGTTPVVNVAADAGGLGPTTGPGAQLWQAATGVDPDQVYAMTLFTTVPEPSTMALAGLGLAALMIFRRRS